MTITARTPGHPGAPPGDDSVSGAISHAPKAKNAPTGFLAAPDTKRCCRCGETKPATDYHQKADAHDGLQSACKACAAVTSRAWRAAHAAPAKPRPSMPALAPKVCPCCGVTFGPHRGESRSNYALRIACCRSCGARIATRAPRSVSAAKAVAPRPSSPPPQALVPRGRITARQIAEYLQASEAVRRLFDPAIAAAAAELGVGR